MPIDIQLCIESFTEYMELENGKMVVIESIALTYKYNDDFHLTQSFLPTHIVRSRDCGELSLCGDLKFLQKKEL